MKHSTPIFLWLFHFLLIAMSVEMYAQNVIVSGTVKDNESKEPLPGVTIMLQGSNVGTVADGNGNFQIPVSGLMDTLLITYIGYSPERVAIAGRSSVEVSLRPDIKQLEEVVVVGFGTQKKINLTGAVTQVDGSVMENRPVTNVGQALQGVVPNLNLTTTGDPGGPGTNASFNIRGNTSIGPGSTGNPLFIVDGMPVDHPNDINPSDIESISVLKDAAASAIYGARAPYGVILITTKRGRKGERATVSYNTMMGTSSYTSLPDMANSYDFAVGLNTASINSGQAPAFDQTALEQIRANVERPGTYPVTGPDPADPNRYLYAHPLNADNVDWFQAYFKPWSFNQKHDLSLRGGSENTIYYLGLGYLNQGGQLRYGDEEFNRYNLTGNITTEPAKWLRVGFKTRFTKRKTDIPYEYANQMGNWIHMATTRHPNWALKNPDGYFSHSSNLMFLTSGGRRKTGEDDLTLIGSIEAEPIKDWKINVDYSYNNQVTKSQFHSAYVYAKAVDGSNYHVGPVPNSVGEGMITDNYQSANFYTSYEKSVGKHHFKGLLGHQMELYNGLNIRGERADLITDEIPAISVATGTQLVFDGILHWATQGTFARINYDYEEKYLLELNGRYDGTSRFPEDNRYGFFPSVSVGYNLAREGYWARLNDIINEFKIRASYGSLGNQNVDNYLYLATIPVRTNLPYILNGTRPSYLGAPGLVSQDLTWETSRTFDVGLDAEFLNNRLSLTYDWYVRNTLNMLGPASVLPSTLGAAVPFQNNANMKTRGFELSIHWRDDIGSHLNYNVGFVLSDYVSEIEQFYNPNNLLPAANNAGVTNYYPGMTLGEIWGYETAGLIQSDEDLQTMPDQSFFFGRWSMGDVLYKDLNSDGKIDAGNNTLGNHGDLKVIGNFTPRYSYGFNLGANWKGIELSIFLQGVGKRDFWLGRNEGNNQGSLFWGFTPGFGNNVYEATLDYWTPENTDAYWPKPYVSSEAGKNHRPQTRYLQNAAYMRVKSIQIGYDFAPILKLSAIQKLKLFASGENVLTFTRLHKNFDPEVLTGAWGAGKIYPLLKTYSLGLNVTF